MNSKFVILVILFTSSFSYAQDDDVWRDSLLVARKAYANKDYVKALKYYESAQKKAPDDIDFSDEMAQSAYRSRDFERAERIYKQGTSAKVNKRERGDAMHNIGNTQMRQKNYEAAVESYKEALRNNPNDEETRYNLSEAVRKIQEQRTPPPKPKNPNKGDSGDENQGDKGQSGDQKNGQGQQGESKGSQSKGSQGQNSQGNPSQGGGSGEASGSKLSNQMVERTLDKLAKKEGETKRKMMGAGAGGRSAKSGKDW